MEEKSLTAKQELFCQEYLVDLNQTQSYIRAYKTKDYIPTVGSDFERSCRARTNEIASSKYVLVGLLTNNNGQSIPTD